VRTGALLQLIESKPEVSKLCFLPDNRTLAIGTTAGIINFWDTWTRSYQRKLWRQRDQITALAFSPDGKTLGSASADGTIKFWDL
jgi:WD40 repeat protein